MEGDVIMTIEKGTELIGVWGAMIPESEGVVVKVDGNMPYPIEVAWDGDYENLSYYNIEDIHEKGWRSANGSPIGVFKKEKK